MMFAIYIGIASIALSLLLLWGLGKWSSCKESPAAAVDIAGALRELLMARAAGQIDQAEFDRQQAALHATVLGSPASTVPSAVRDKRLWMIPGAIVLLAIALYFAFSRPGTVSAPDALPPIPPLNAGGEPAPANTKGGDLNTVVKRLADKMESDPKNGEGWLLLAKTYNELRRFAEADAAYAKAAALLPADATMLADWADVHVMARDRKWDEAGRDIVKKALTADPKHVKSLALAGSEAFDRKDYKGAIALWKRMKAAAEPGSMDSKLADANIAEAEAVMSGKPARSEPAPAAFNGAVGGKVVLSAKLAGKVAAGDTLFVLAKAPDGKGAPLAVWKHQGKNFPVEFRLDDSAAIIPGRVISQFAEVLISAKISKSGMADSANGDIVAPAVKTKIGNTSVALELSELVAGK